jgi:hypothetical protein
MILIIVDSLILKQSVVARSYPYYALVFKRDTVMKINLNSLLDQMASLEMSITHLFLLGLGSEIRIHLSRISLPHLPRCFVR